ncbi:thiamine-phosphate kinase [Edaphobacter albus]|uniref:thiamine-phosphate kinase n=1 Tax=Edaphobacter sp. 4G125 TaxID=2763071 RepID=UPI001647AAB3|nr:thiamine-phosphate kinase [Edaphobacter sp. 4G125]QNI36160.1 thiamine-phosphate kinase [Edaphobacter sp. 4G125]
MVRQKFSIRGELDLIEQIRRTFSHKDSRHKNLALGIGDDCAILRPPTGHEILVTTDFTIENRHFRRNLHPPFSVGHRCLARGLSDLAAMGATPLAAFLSLALPALLLRTRKGQHWIKEFFSGLHALAQEHHTPLAGGDTSESPADLILADIILVGSAPRGRALRRSGAHTGDVLYVTGALGGAHAELTALLKKNRRSRINTATQDHPHLFPQPRLAVGAALLQRNLASAAIDLSDGLSTDLTHLCESSKLRAEIEVSSIPLHPLTQKLSHEDALHAALNGGEDYELLFAAPANKRVPRRIAGVPITQIGTLHPSRPGRPRITLNFPDGTTSGLKPAGWQHFSR